jgi:hypothetical protein
MKVRPTVEPKNVKVTGPGVSSKGIPASIPADFVVDTTEAGYGDLQVQVLVSSPLCPLFALSINLSECFIFYFPTQTKGPGWISAQSQGIRQR